MPNTIAQNLVRLQQAKSDIADAIITKGGTVNSGDGLEDFATDIGTIPSGDIDISKALKTTRPRYIDCPQHPVFAIQSGGTPSYTSGSDIWSDGTDLYISHGSVDYQYIFNRSTNSWTTISWNIGELYGSSIWSDGTDIYYGKNYVFDKANKSWVSKTWNNAPNSFNPTDVWTDGDNIYYTSSNSSFIIDTETSTFIPKTWNGSIVPWYGKYMWTDGTNIYHGYMYTTAGTTTDKNYILDKDTSTWYENTTCKVANGGNVWTDGFDTYNSESVRGTYYTSILDRTTLTWSATGITLGNSSTVFAGTNIWTDGVNIYHTWSGTTYKIITRGYANKVTIPTISCRP